MASLIVGASGLGLGLTFGAAAALQEKKVEDAKKKGDTFSETRGDYTKGQRYAKAANACYLLGMLGAGAFAAFWIAESVQTTSSQAALVIGPGHLGIAGQF